MLITERTKKRLTAWWNREEQEQPCVMVRIPGEEASTPDTADLGTWWTDEEFVIARAMAVIDLSRFRGEAVPYHYINFGSNSMAGCLGADLIFRDKVTSWSDPIVGRLEEVLGLDVREDNRWWRLIRNVTHRSVSLAKGHHYVTCMGLSGITDTLAAVFGVEPFLISLLEDPRRVKRVCRHLLETWIRVYRQVDDLIRTAGNDGYVAGWPGVWSPGTSYPLQEDVSCMMSEAMFDEFCLPGIDALTQVLEYPYYHLDGPKAIRFVDSLASLPRLKAIQWIPGAGHERLDQWHDLVRHILKKGKSVHVYAYEEEIEPLIRAVGARGLLISLRAAAPRQSAVRVAERYCRA